MNHLLRSLAPLSDAAWSVIDDQARASLRHYLAARKLVDFSGPHGWEHSAHNLGRVEAAANGPVEGVESRQRVVQPLVELRTPFVLARTELEALDRGANDADLTPLIDASRCAALAEDRLVFTGSDAAGAPAIVPASTHQALQISDDYEQYPALVARAVDALQQAGVEGPYGIALGPRCYRGVVETTERGGIIVFDHLRRILGGPIVRAPAVSGAVVVSMRGGDFSLVVGQDLSVGYLSHDASAVQLYLEESLTFQVVTPEAAVVLSYS